jgi:hypothetical protein
MGTGCNYVLSSHIGGTLNDMLFGDVDGAFELFNRLDIVSQITWTVGEEETVKLMPNLCIDLC